MLTAADFVIRKKREPFIPFRIVTDAGESYVVPNRWMIMVGKRDVSVGFPTWNDPQIFESFERVCYSNIVAVEDLPPATTGPPQQYGNGGPST